VNAILGTELNEAQIAAYLDPLGLRPSVAGEVVVVDVPTYRPDIEREIDVIEEVARHHGYNNIDRRVARSVSGGGLTARQREQRLVRDALAGAGLLEAWTLSLIGAADLERAGLPTDGVEIENPLRAEERLLRPALLPGLLNAAAFNADHGLSDVALFEVGHVFLPPTEGTGVLPDERDHVAAVLTGTHGRRPHEPDRPVDAFDAIAVWDALVEALGLADVRREPAHRAPFHPTRAAALVVDGATVGHVGEIAPDVRAAFGLDVPAVAFEAHLDALLAAARRDQDYAPGSRFPASNFDLAFVIDDDVPAGRVQATLTTAAGELLEHIRAFDVFRSDALGAGRRSVAYALRVRAPDRTLTDEDVATVRQRCIDAVVAAHGATLRG
jgi:phenylalanyl-tRNA synthetase beta chain